MEGKFRPRDARRRTDAGAGRYLVTLVFAGYVLNFVDRQIVSVVLEPIKAEFGISDAGLGLITGLGFAVFYAVVGMPIAVLSDRYSRKAIVSACMAVWSAATAAFGMATTYSQLLLARMVVGVGESGFAPAALSMLADHYPHERRGTVTAISLTGALAGTIVGLSLGGYAAHQWGWRAAMLIAGAPGIVFSVLFYLTIREPLRGAAERVVSAAPSARSLHFLDLCRNRAYVCVLGAACCMLFVMNGVVHWLPSFLIRSHAYDVEQAGMVLGPLIGGVGALSVLAGGFLTDRLARFDERWGLWLSALVVAAAAPALAAAFYTFNRTATLTLFGIAYFGMTFMSAPIVTMIQNIVPVPLRARATAGFFLVTTLVGLGLGPVYIGTASEVLAPLHGVESLRYAILTAVPALLLSPLLLHAAARRLVDLRAAAPAGA